MAVTGFITGIILLVIAFIFILISALKKKSFTIPITLMVIGFIIAAISLFNLGK